MNEEKIFLFIIISQICSIRNERRKKFIFIFVLLLNNELIVGHYKCINKKKKNNNVTISHCLLYMARLSVHLSACVRTCST